MDLFALDAKFEAEEQRTGHDFRFIDQNYWYCKNCLMMVTTEYLTQRVIGTYVMPDCQFHKTKGNKLFLYSF